VLLVGVLIVTALNFADGDISTGDLVFTGVFVVLAWWAWPGRRGPHISHAEAQAGADDDDVIIYWRPG